MQEIRPCFFCDFIFFKFFEIYLKRGHPPLAPPARVSSRVGLARVGMGLGGHPRPPKNKGEGVPPSPFSAVVRGGVVDYSVPRHQIT